MKPHRYLLSILLLTSCTVGPDYIKPKLSLPNQFKEAQGKSLIAPNPKQWQPVKPRDHAAGGRWWIVFDDSQLNALEDRLNQGNQTIRNAIANYQQACAIVDEARASYYPSVSAAFNIIRQRSGGGSASFFNTTNGVTSIGTASTGSGSSNRSINVSYSGLVNASWEPDIWGLVRRTVDSDRAAAEASRALIAVTRLSVQGALAQYYFELRALDTDQYLLNQIVSGYKKYLQLTRNQYHAGVASLADVVQAQSQLEMATAQAIHNGILRGQYEHAIAVLMGLPPAALTLEFKPLQAKLPVIPLSVPSQWLERRPDVAQAERQMQQMNAQIGIAVAAYYPSLNLSSTASGVGNGFHQLLHTPNIGWSYGLQLAESIYDGGYRQAAVRAAKAAYMAQVASYKQTVLTAFQDVEDNLIALRLLNQQVIMDQKAAASANTVLRLVINQYKAGTVPYSSVISAQISAYNAEKTAVDTQGLQMTAAVGLIKALGGGWSLDDTSYSRDFAR